MEPIFEYPSEDFDPPTLYTWLMKTMGLPQPTDPTLEPHAISSELASHARLWCESDFDAETKACSSSGKTRVFTLYFLTANAAAKYKELIVSKKERTLAPEYNNGVKEAPPSEAALSISAKAQSNLGAFGISDWNGDMTELGLAFVPESGLVLPYPEPAAHFPKTWVLRDAVVHMHDAGDTAAAAKTRPWELGPQPTIPNLGVIVVVSMKLVTKVYHYPHAPPHS